jgi:hypothetical protein
MRATPEWGLYVVEGKIPGWSNRVVGGRFFVEKFLFSPAGAMRYGPVKMYILDIFA